MTIESFPISAAPQAFGAPENPWVLFFAGWGAEIADYQERLQLLAEDFYVLGFNLPGFGDGEPLPTNNTVKGHAAFFTNYLMNELELDRQVILMGHSTGAGVATLVASMLQSQARDLVLVSPIGSPDPVLKSGPRMIRNINWKKARRWLHGNYRRRFVPNMKLGLDAKHVDITSDIIRLHEQGTAIKLFFATDDRVAPAGKLANLLDVHHITWVEGGHAWFKHDATLVHEYLLTLKESLIDRREPENGGGWWANAKRLFADAVGYIERLLVPSTPILMETVIKADENLQNDGQTKPQEK
jgi:pimeloyl-ACP methyl ester carboxylesterase